MRCNFHTTQLTSQKRIFNFNMCVSRVLMVHTFNLGSWEVGAGRIFEFEASLVYAMARVGVRRQQSGVCFLLLLYGSHGSSSDLLASAFTHRAIRLTKFYNIFIGIHYK